MAKPTEKAIGILNVVLRLLSQSFQQGVLTGEGFDLEWKKKGEIDQAFKSLKASLGVLIKGADREAERFLKGLREDVDFSAPELSPGKLWGRFLAFRAMLVERGFLADHAIDATLEPVYSDNIRPSHTEEEGEVFECLDCKLNLTTWTEQCREVVVKEGRRLLHVRCPECGKLSHCFREL